MAEDVEDRYIKPIVNASFPGTLAALSMTVFGIIDIRGTPPIEERILLLSGSICFLISAFSIFFYSIYPTRTRLWSTAALFFLIGLIASLVVAFFLVIDEGNPNPY